MVEICYLCIWDMCTESEGSHSEFHKCCPVNLQEMKCPLKLLFLLWKYQQAAFSDQTGRDVAVLAFIEIIFLSRYLLLLVHVIQRSDISTYKNPPHSLLRSETRMELRHSEETAWKNLADFGRDGALCAHSVLTVEMALPCIGGCS